MVRFKNMNDKCFDSKRKIKKRIQKRKANRIRGTYFRDRQEKVAIAEGRIPHQDGKPVYLSSYEEEQLVQQISDWKDPLSHPTLAGVASMVFFCFLFFTYIFALGKHPHPFLGPQHTRIPQRI
jgi:hypothetical protein